MELTFEKTCSACPEQYDVFDQDGNMVAYVRLRGGRLSVSEDVMEALIYQHTFENDIWKGCFDDDEEREKYMKIITEKIIKHYSTK